jgi:hypothetical protein
MWTSLLSSPYIVAYIVALTLYPAQAGALTWSAVILIRYGIKMLRNTCARS